MILLAKVALIHRIHVIESFASLIDTCILFTRGSKSLPRGFANSDTLSAYLAYRLVRGNDFETLLGDTWCTVTPNGQSTEFTTWTIPMMLSARIAYLSDTFSVENNEIRYFAKGARTLSVPAMVSAIAASIDPGSTAHTAFIAAMFAGAPPTTSQVQGRFAVLGARSVCIR